ncbi:hypothetical protein SISNIDRAFT_465836 [Sistotremastrum niveocremeum HHB9708]|uniref:MULE transposase domain-containing protein n=1 Tax=Sistotremastrum niveocremeum HHB9708 TaxID=1314777 RepID=A0A164UYN4_9AGAM|nr:hypothetical protein SISNIDRAFT_465836 [Sistotremastrum niveocremeum HHB9708]
MRRPKRHVPLVPPTAKGSVRPGRPAKARRQRAQDQTTAPSSPAELQVRFLQAPRTPSPVKKRTRRGPFAPTAEDETEESLDHQIFVTPNTARDLRRRAAGFLIISASPPAASVKSVRQNGPSQKRHRMLKIDRDPNEWRMIKKVPLDELVYVFEQEKNDFRLKVRSIAAEVEQHWIQEKGIDLLDPRARRFALKVGKDVDARLWDQIKADDEVVYRHSLECSGTCCPIVEDGSQQGDGNASDGQSKHGTTEEDRGSGGEENDDDSEDDLDEGGGFGSDNSEGGSDDSWAGIEDADSKPDSEDGYSSGSHREHVGPGLKSFRAPKGGAKEGQPAKKKRKRETRETRACKVQWVLEIVARDLTTVEIWQRHRHKDCADPEKQLEYSRHIRAIVGDSAREGGSVLTAGTIMRNLTDRVEKGHPNGPKLPLYRQPDIYDIRTVVNTMRKRGRLHADAFQALGIFAERNPERVFMYGPPLAFRGCVLTSSQLPPIYAKEGKGPWNRVAYWHYGSVGVALDSKFRGVNENYAPLTLIITVDNNGHGAPGAAWVTQNIKKRTLVAMLQAFLEKLLKRCQQLADGAEIEDAWRRTPEECKLIRKNASRILKHGFQPLFWMIDKSTAEKNAILEIWPDACIRICQFHVIQAITRYNSGTAGSTKKNEAIHMSMESI